MKRGLWKIFKLRLTLDETSVKRRDFFATIETCLSLFLQGRGYSIMNEVEGWIFFTWFLECRFAFSLWFHILQKIFFQTLYVFWCIFIFDRSNWVICPCRGYKNSAWYHPYTDIYACWYAGCYEMIDSGTTPFGRSKNISGEYLSYLPSARAWAYTRIWWSSQFHESSPPYING